MQALFAQLKTAGKLFATYDRIVVPITNYPAVTGNPLPACILMENFEMAHNPGRGMPDKRVWTPTVLIYAAIPKGTPGMTILNPLIDAITAPATGVLYSDDITKNVNTLGGLVYWCRVDGRLLKISGDVASTTNSTGNAVVSIPIKITVP